jgi:CDGSH-type Zn-finger protein
VSLRRLEEQAVLRWQPRHGGVHGHTINRVARTALCRCGHSSNKPYRDGTHAKVGFESE